MGFYQNKKYDYISLSASIKITFLLALVSLSQAEDSDITQNAILHQRIKELIRKEVLTYYTDDAELNKA